MQTSSSRNSALSDIAFDNMFSIKLTFVKSCHTKNTFDCVFFLIRGEKNFILDILYFDNKIILYTYIQFTKANIKIMINNLNFLFLNFVDKF